LDSEGLFRVPGSHQGMQELQEHFDNGQNPDLVKVPTDDVAGLLKKYLRELPEPLLSDCTPEDTLQHAFQEAMAIKDEDLHVEKLKELLAKLPRYRRALCKELFFLFNSVAQHEESNKMNKDNLATIFGGMGNIFSSVMNSYDKTRFVTLLINYYGRLFSELDLIEPKKEHPESPRGAANKKPSMEGIRIYLVDGTFQSLFCSSVENAKSIAKKTGTKIQRVHNYDISNYELFEIVDGRFRKIGSDEKVLPIYKTGSMILFTDMLKEEKEEKNEKKRRRCCSNRW